LRRKAERGCFSQPRIASLESPKGEKERETPGTSSNLEDVRCGEEPSQRVTNLKKAFLLYPRGGSETGQEVIRLAHWVFRKVGRIKRRRPVYITR